MTKQEKTYTNRERLDIERRKAAQMTDHELLQQLEKQWNDGDFPETEWKPEDRENLYGKISSRISSCCYDLPQPVAPTGSRKFLSLKKALRYAAVILFPLLIFSTIYYYGLSTRGIDSLSVVRTERGERAIVTLPDGTKVEINADSELSYNPYSFAKGERTVNLEGEAYFTVTSDPSHPFTVYANDVSVNVKGTKFNVQSRDNSGTASVFLTEGAVEMRCDGISEAIILEPWQKAIFDKNNGTLEIITTDSKDIDIAWLNNEIIFRNEPLENVIRTIEMQYGVRFDTSGLGIMANDRFTGTLPADDLSTLLDILEEVYEIKFTINGRTLTLDTSQLEKNKKI